MEKLDLPKDEILRLYEDGFGAGKIAKNYGCAKRTILLRLHEWEVQIRPSKSPRINLEEEKLKNLYLKRKLSAQKIADFFDCSENTVFRRLAMMGIKSRNSSEAHIKYPRKAFSGNKFEKAYLVGFAIGDLRTRFGGKKDSKTLKVGCGSTKKEQIELFKTLFENYGKVWIGKPDIKGRRNMEVSLDLSFSFLLNTGNKLDKIMENQKLFRHFLAGFIDAEGSFYITKNQANSSLGNYNGLLLKKIKQSLLRYGIEVPRIHQDKKLYIGKDGYTRKKYYWHLSVNKKKYLLKLIDFVGPFLKHSKRRFDMKKAEININERNKSSIGDKS